MKKLYHLFVTNFKLQIKLPHLASQATPSKFEGDLLSSHLKPQTFYLKPHTSHLIPLFAFCILLTSCTEVKREYYKTGKIKSETYYRFGKETGTTTYYHERYPTKTMEIEMKKGKKNGRLIKRYFDNRIESVSYYQNDLLEGKESYFYKNGNPQMEIHYTKGLKNGPVTSWYDNGVVKETGTYINDRFDGEWMNYDERGMIIGEGKFENGTGKRIIYDYMGRLKSETNYVNNLQEGLQIHYLPSGEIEKTQLFKEDRIIEINGVPIDSL